MLWVMNAHEALYSFEHNQNSERNRTTTPGCRGQTRIPNRCRNLPYVQRRAEALLRSKKMRLSSIICDS